MRRDNYTPASGLGMLEDVFNWGLRLAGLVIFLVTAYYIYGTIAASDQLFRAIDQPGKYLPVQEFQRSADNMALFTKVLFVASVVLIVSMLGRYLPYAEAGAALAIVGVVLFFGVPMVVDNMGGPAQALPKAFQKAIQSRGFIDPRAYLKGQFSFCGMLFLGAGLADLLVHGVIWAASARARRPKPNEESAKTASQVRKTENKFLGKCWELPFCRDTDKKLCPIRSSNKPHAGAREGAVTAIKT